MEHVCDAYQEGCHTVRHRISRRDIRSIGESAKRHCKQFIQQLQHIAGSDLGYTSQSGDFDGFDLRCRRWFQFRPNSGFYGYNGSDGVSNAVVNGGTSISQGGGAGNGDPGTNDNIGYVSADWTLVAAANQGLESSIPPAQNVVNGGTSYAPNATNALAALASITGTGTNAPGNASDLLTYGTNPGNLGLPAVPSTGYPISVYAYAIFPQCFASDAASQAVYATLLDLFGYIFQNPSAINLLANYQLGPISDPLLTAVENIFNDTPANPAVGFQDSSVCTGTTASASGTTPGTASGRVTHN